MDLADIKMMQFDEVDVSDQAVWKNVISKQQDDE